MKQNEVREWNLPPVLIAVCCIDLGPPVAEELLMPPLHGEVEQGAASSLTTAVRGDGAVGFARLLRTFCWCCWGRMLVVTSATWRHGVAQPPELLTGSFLICTIPPFGQSTFPPAVIQKCGFEDIKRNTYSTFMWCSAHKRLARWIKRRACDVGEAKEGLKNELWRRWINGRVGEWTKYILEKMSDVGKATEGLENELWHSWSDGKIGEWAKYMF